MSQESVINNEKTDSQTHGASELLEMKRQITQAEFCS